MQINVMKITQKIQIPVIVTRSVNVNNKFSIWRYNANTKSNMVKLFGGDYNPERDSAMIGNY